MKKLDRKSASPPPFKTTCLCNILLPLFCKMYTCYWICLVWNNKYIWEWKVVLNFRFAKLLHNLKPLDSRHLWDQVNMSVIDKYWLSRAYFRNLGQRSIMARKGTLYEKGNFFLKKGPKKSTHPLLNSFSKCFVSR